MKKSLLNGIDSVLRNNDILDSSRSVAPSKFSVLIVPHFVNDDGFNGLPTNYMKYELDSVINSYWNKAHVGAIICVIWMSGDGYRHLVDYMFQKKFNDSFGSRDVDYAVAQHHGNIIHHIHQ